MDRQFSLKRRKYKKRWTEKCKDYVRNFLAFMFSNIGIIGLVVGYTVAGAFIFIYIEGDAEVLLRRTISMQRNHKADTIWSITNLTNIFNEKAWKKHIMKELEEYQITITHAVKNGLDGTDIIENNKSWSFPGAFLYSLTVITTIGYGNVVPRTRLGKIITIIYAIIGMPLFLLYLSNIGDIMARSFKWIYAKLCLCRCCPGVTRKREERQRRRAEEISVDYYGNKDESESPEVSINRGNYQDKPYAQYNYRDTDSSEDVSENITVTSYDTETVTVPITICLLIMVGYILGGSVLFAKYEEKWTTLDGSYFCFISLSTIGFGDLVPGKAIYSDRGFQLSSILVSMYLMLGMALIAMCFNLMQEEVIHKIRTTIRAVKNIFRCNR
ncbi:hypothetical protein RN001_011377 [Aquatica leii]|uniref:Potassium channel domain-containing protein n=1 Tax=Aquatica leii TaxID=1421715 RepID=A0AAN7PC44_9COLE|nr:hypothetical protein RN001_011377 [Aquatica leii]